MVITAWDFSPCVDSWVGNEMINMNRDRGAIIFMVNHLENFINQFQSGLLTASGWVFNKW